MYILWSTERPLWFIFVTQKCNENEKATKSGHGRIRLCTILKIKMDWNNKNLVLTKVQGDGWSLEYESETLKNDREIVLVAVQQYGYASETLEKDRNFLIHLKCNGFLIDGIL